MLPILEWSKWRVPYPKCEWKYPQPHKEWDAWWNPGQQWDEQQDPQ